MKIAFVTTEAVPFAKTGGLADVSGALPIALQRLGHEVIVLMPAFRSVHMTRQPISETDMVVHANIAGRGLSARISRSTLPQSDVPVYFVDNPELFDRQHLYGDAQGDYQDNPLRFSFFCRICLQVIDRICPDLQILHCNDWQTGLLPAYLATRFDGYQWMQQAKSVLTIHNLAYQGIFPKDTLSLTGLGWEHFHFRALEFYDQVNLLKAGLSFADALTTVSQRYSEEIQAPEQGCGLDGVLRDRAERLFGIPNGIDPQIWDPRTDNEIASTYDAESWKEGKASNRAALREAFDLPHHHRVPLVGMIGRLAEQKGWDLVVQAMRQLFADEPSVQFVVLGTGDPRYQDALKELATRYPDRLGLHLGFSDRLAHRIEAGADIFLMPSRYEPCGLNQLYSLRYGTVPVVQPTGGLADTVTAVDASSIADGSATGFYLPHYNVEGLVAALTEAVQTCNDRPELWDQIVRRGMRQEWSWERSAKQYLRVYEQTISRNEN